MPEIAERFLHTRIARSVEAIKRSFVDNLFYITGRTLKSANTIDHYTALAYTIRDRMLARMVASGEHYKVRGAKSVAYISAEFLTGPHLANNILNLKLGDRVREAITSLGLDLDTILDAEEEPGLGNGGLEYRRRMGVVTWLRAGLEQRAKDGVRARWAADSPAYLAAKHVYTRVKRAG